MRKGHYHIIRKRLHFFVYSFTFIFLLLILKLSWYSIIKHEEYFEKSYNQRLTKIDVFPSRGYIFDRNNIPLTNRSRQKTLFIYNYKLNNEEIFDYVLNKTGISKNRLTSLMNKSKTYELIQIPIDKDINNDEIIREAFVLDIVKRYDDNNYLSHVIGYYNETNEYGSGIEYSYNDTLKNDNIDNTIIIARDGDFRFWPELNYTEVINQNEEYKSVKLTIDYHIQKITEDIFDKYQKKGAVIVSSVETGDILAMASRPNYSLNDLASYLDSKDENFYNRTIAKTYPPASLWKTVVMLAALEDEKIDLEEKLYCNGYEVVGNTIVKCISYEEGGHGELNIVDAYKYSCNSSFIQLGKRIGSKKIMDVARRLGFGKPINVGFPHEEKKGNLPNSDNIYKDDIGNNSIGQGEIEVTPLQITNMMMIIANDGIKKDMTIYDGYVNSDGDMEKAYNRDKDEKIIEKKYTDILKYMMVKVVSEGTAKKYISLNNLGGASGKTGTAELDDNDYRKASWFSGFFPNDNPKYVITVLVEDKGAGGRYAGPIFNDIAKEVSKIKK